MASKRPPSPPPAARGRPRSESARRAVLESARELFEQGGYTGTTIEAIAARSGVAKTTIYRWWPHRAALLVELLLQLAEAAAPPPSGDDPVRALKTELRRVAHAADALPGRLLLALLGEAQCDLTVRTALNRGLFDPRRRATARVIRQAQRSGALRPGVPPLLAVDLVYGPLFYRRFIRQEPLSETFVRQVFGQLMHGLGSRRRGKPAARGSSTGGKRRGREEA